MKRLLLAVIALSAPAAAPPPGLAIDMQDGWLRRDWKQCADVNRVVTVEAGVVTFRTDRSAAMLWQVPTHDGAALVDRDQGWVESCSRPPLALSRSLALQGRRERLVSLALLPRLTWRWQVDAPVEDRGLAEPSGRIRRAADDFAAKLGVLVHARDHDEVQEVAYVWTKTVPVGTVLFQESRLFPFWKAKQPRIVARAGSLHAWVDEARDLAADFRRLHGLEPGWVVRVYVMSDADATGGRATARFAAIRFQP